MSAHMEPEQHEWTATGPTNFRCQRCGLTHSSLGGLPESVCVPNEFAGIARFQGMHAPTEAQSGRTAESNHLGFPDSCPAAPYEVVTDCNQLAVPASPQSAGEKGGFRKCIERLLARANELEEVEYNPFESVKVSHYIDVYEWQEQRIRELEATLRWVLHDVREWCEAVDKDATWDSWDDYYKSFQYGGVSKAEAVLSSSAPAEMGDGRAKERA